MVGDIIVNGLDVVWAWIKEFIILILVILYVLIFFVAQFYLIKGYSFLFKITFKKIIATYEYFAEKNENVRKIKQYFTSAFE